MLGANSSAIRHAGLALRTVSRPIALSAIRFPASSSGRVLDKCSSTVRCSTLLRPTVSLFCTSSRRSLLPPLPQRLEGTANDPTPVPDPSPTHGSYHWGFERAVSVALIPLVVTPFAAGSLNPVMDAVLCGTVVIHSHIGFQSMIIDYIPKKRVPKWRALFWWGLNAGTILVAIGLYEFETNDVGVTEAVKRIWLA